MHAGFQQSCLGGTRGAKIEKLVDAEELVPYRALDAFELSGSGQWDARPYISDLPYMPFVGRSHRCLKRRRPVAIWFEVHCRRSHYP